MENLTNNRLTILGRAKMLEAFEPKNWLKLLGGKHRELYSCPKTRDEWWFSTEGEAPLKALTQLSRTWPHLIFLLEFDNEQRRVKGLAKLKNRKVELCQLVY
jgi:hypothetical protein